ncbi:DUF1330 domain-containing protein [Sphingorhabdus sp. Alg239-R122]|uniref:DUF1330 domain-containing protein n=1 Tax=Sphingorhabdus sp. Alg239-R122 TaxID=2305989 RepID=UPI0013DB45BA|nr:DUF1330 domain-containing protein [Sphingorhabdus sp. Alg239-R122]
MKVVNQVIPSAERMQEFFGGKEDGPFVMVNLLKFKDKAEYPDGRETSLSGAEAYALYSAAVTKCLAEVGGKPHYAGPVTGLMLGEVEENWDMIALAEYPSLEAMRTMITSPEYQEITVHRTAGLAGQLNIKTKPGSF